MTLRRCAQPLVCDDTYRKPASSADLDGNDNQSLMCQDRALYKCKTLQMQPRRCAEAACFVPADILKLDSS